MRPKVRGFYGTLEDCLLSERQLSLPFPTKLATVRDGILISRHVLIRRAPILAAVGLEGTT
jgi:hypothetical protein